MDVSLVTRPVVLASPRICISPMPEAQCAVPLALAGHEAEAIAVVLEAKAGKVVASLEAGKPGI
ncbi:hypothetical protein ACQVP2_33970 [Methylobacterium aquaticum]|uniref:hypothetical protein n=1 Tax=Methylobacterium aquaticum TaxID=270351 RepID=UPI003D18435F